LEAVEGSKIGSMSVLAGVLTAATACASLTKRPATDSKEAADKEKEPADKELQAFNVMDPSTYGNITMDDVKKYGAAGTAAYVLTELAFWAIAVPSECFTFYYTAGRWPDWSSTTDQAAVLGFVFAASNIARLCLPLRFGAALALAPWVDENIMARLPGRSSS